MKNQLIAGYIIIALICSVYFKACSTTSNRSYPYNLGRGLTWPISVLIFHGK
ncbi:hypothetical protein [Alkanindiges illinoisensis]|uniref:hypothetical protein n=1 Tax=Alkanindiges illinoisensis TaxID=197183 RepID=UPI00146FC165|nr:hypothetical protein [Alkanindiges illinoisensis]